MLQFKLPNMPLLHQKDLKIKPSEQSSNSKKRRRTGSKEYATELGPNDNTSQNGHKLMQILGASRRSADGKHSLDSRPLVTDSYHDEFSGRNRNI